MPLSPEQLEARLHAVLREQPLRRAPDTLAQRVLAEIARREALPWWRKSYAYWPGGVRVAFLLASLAAVAAVAYAAVLLWGGRSLDAEVNQLLEPARNGFGTIRAAATALADVVRGWIPTISPMWIYAGLAVVGTAYATLVGLGATAYRLLLQPR